MEKSEILNKIKIKFYHKNLVIYKNEKIKKII